MYTNKFVYIFINVTNEMMVAFSCTWMDGTRWSINKKAAFSFSNSVIFHYIVTLCSFDEIYFFYSHTLVHKCVTISTVQSIRRFNIFAMIFFFFFFGYSKIENTFYLSPFFFYQDPCQLCAWKCAFEKFEIVI